MAGGSDEKTSNNVDADHKQPLSWSDILRPIVNIVIPCWHSQCHPLYYLLLQYSSNTSIPTLTGTILCPVNNNAKLRLCFQRTPLSPPLVLIELPLRTREFAGLVQLGTTRMIFTGRDPKRSEWIIVCNGKSMGVATKEVVEKDKELLKMINAVSTGAGILPSGDGSSCGFKYLKGQFERTVGPDDSIAYHLVGPSGYLGQDLSFIFIRH
ncbi:uncharacterized protein LOC116211351 [Punica granatum]|uniref:Protein MIZU-KUSSEI 1-like n=2 Tax=Punica granatum TaxID=22663 RepID=A0A218WI73_PUNGR|nr:uncharacterized protein LOC116211351 [Punica granatum]OWM72515.1 hypothetical protein CDL15_Pgr018368 [Punica granatum]PKI69508.1 hypothetical protein CRG98_010083 [Punica granatum]